MATEAEFGRALDLCGSNLIAVRIAAAGQAAQKFTTMMQSRVRGLGYYEKRETVLLAVRQELWQVVSDER